MPQPCPQLEDTFLQAFVDGEFEGEESAEVKAHLAGCHACAQAVRRQESYKAALQRSNGAAPHALHDALKLKIAAESRQQNRWAHALRDPRAVALCASFVGAAAWFLAGGLSHPLFTRGAAHSLADDGIALHTRALPLDYTASDVGSAQQWLSSKLDFGVRLPRFAQGPQLQGVRLSSVHARPGAVVTYALRPDGRRVSLLIVDDPESQLAGSTQKVADREVHMVRSRGFNVASWRTDEVVYSLVSDLDESDVLALVQAAEQR